MVRLPDAWMALILAPLSNADEAGNNLRCDHVRAVTDGGIVTLPVYYDRDGRIDLGASGIYLDITRRRLEWRNVRDEIIAAWLAPGGDGSDLTERVIPWTPGSEFTDLVESVLSSTNRQSDTALEMIFDAINTAYREAVRDPLRRALNLPATPEYVPRTPADYRRAIDRAKELLAKDPPKPFSGGRWELPGVTTSEQIIDVIWRVLHGMGVNKNNYIATRGSSDIKGLKRRGPSPLLTETLRTVRPGKGTGSNGRLRVLCGATPCTGHLGEVWRADDPDPRAITLRAWAFLTRCASDDEPPVSDWLLFHKEGYWWDGWVYGIVNPKKETIDPLARWGVLPKPMQNATAIDNEGHGLVGRFPSPPCIIRCPQCGQLSKVA